MFIPYAPNSTVSVKGSTKINESTKPATKPSTKNGRPKTPTIVLKPNTKPLFETKQATTTATTFSPATDIAGNPYGKPKKTDIPPPEDPVLVGKTTPIDVKFNLPPHLWSIPINQQTLNSKNKELKDYFVGFDHGLRRAIMWCYGQVPIDNSSYSWIGSGLENDKNALKFDDKKLKLVSPVDTNWGFQFLWNPETIGNSLSRNANFTPSSVDKTSKFFGLFTAMEAVSFKVVIDRVNDFACIKSSNDYANIAKNYYSANGYPGNPENAVEQVKTLAKLGTMADIEYIFKMINGEGTNGYVWKNALGRKTADLGFLAPTVVAVQFGPNEDSLSYVGYVDGITISHSMFTEDMIPIHSEVNINFVAYARTSLAQKQQ